MEDILGKGMVVCISLLYQIVKHLITLFSEKHIISMEQFEN